MSEGKISEIVKEVPIHRTPPEEYVPGFNDSLEKSKARSPIIRPPLPPREYQGYDSTSRKTFGEVLKNSSEVNQFRVEISKALGIQNPEEKRTRLSKIASEIKEHKQLLSENINAGLADPAETELYGDLNFLEEKYLYPNLPPEAVPVPRVEVQPLAPVSGVEQGRLDTKRWIENFFQERYIEERREGEPLGDFLSRIYGSILDLTTSTVWNGIYDQKHQPYTNDYQTLPTKGPLREIDVLGHQQVYNGADSNRVKDLGAFCDQFHAYFSDPVEQAEAMKFEERLKEVLREVSIWHNRAVVINSNVDPKGPDGSLQAYEQIKSKGLDPRLKFLFNRREMSTETEKNFSKGVEFCMGVWAAMALKKSKLRALLPYLSDDVRWFVDDEFRVGRPLTDPTFPSSERNKYKAVPDYNSDKDKSLQLVTDMVARAQASFGLTKKQAELAYHIGESFRLGSGIHYLYDVKFIETTDKEDPSPIPRKIGASKVNAQEGTPKALSIGYYVEGVPTTEARPTFNQVFAETMVHGYAPFGVLTQYSHEYRAPGSPQVLDLAGYGDNRATLLELLAVRNGVETIKWETRSTNPDKAVYDGATQAIKFLWNRASIKGAAENPFFLDPKNIPLAKTEILNREDEINRLQIHYGMSGPTVKALAETVRKANFARLPWEAYEEKGFDSDSDAITGPRKEHIVTLMKDARDYWVSAFTADLGRYPADFLRTVEFLFSRDDRPFVNDKMRDYIQDAKAEHRTATTNEAKGNSAKKLKSRLTGYITYDVLMKSLFYLMKPDFSTVDRKRYDLRTQAGIEKAYQDINFSNWETLAVKTLGGYRLPQVAVVMHMINQCMELRDLLPEEQKTLHDSGYRLSGDRNTPDPDSLIFDRNDLLVLSRKYGMGEGYHYIEQTNAAGEIFLQLSRDKGHRPTQQYLVDRIILMNLLFRAGELSLVGKK